VTTDRTRIPDPDALGRHLVRVMSDLPNTEVLTWEQMSDNDRDEARAIAAEIFEGFLSEFAPPRRVFFAHVALMGHRDLGLCRVEEVTLGGQEALRATTLTEETERVHWTRTASIWCAEEVSEADALAQAQKARERREHRAAEQAKREREHAAEVAEARALRVGAYLLVSTTDDGNVELRALRDGANGPEVVPGALKHRQFDVSEALRAAKADFYHPGPVYADGHCIGFSLHAAHRAGAIAEAFKTLGFDRVERTGPVDDSDGEEMDF